MSERSRIYEKNQHIIIEDDEVPQKKVDQAPILEEIKAPVGKMES